jgi:hypothetical protein
VLGGTGLLPWRCFRFTTVVPVPLRNAWADLPELLALHDALAPGALFVRNRWAGGAWVEAATAHEQISAAKFNQFAGVCQQLGARRLAVGELREVTETGKVTGAVDLRVKTADGRAQAAAERLDRLAQSIKASWMWRTGAADLPAARRHAEETGLAADPVIAGLIQQRESAVNPLDEHTLEFDLNAEARRELAFALELKTALGSLGPALAATFDRIADNAHHLRLTVDVQFAAP